MKNFKKMLIKFLVVVGVLLLGFCFENRVYATQFKNAADGNLSSEKLVLASYIPDQSDKNFYFIIPLGSDYNGILENDNQNGLKVGAFLNENLAAFPKGTSSL